MLDPANVIAEAEKKKPEPKDWRLGFVKARYTALMLILHKQLGPEEFKKMIQKMGRNCSSSWHVISDCKNNPDKYFKIMKERFKEDITYDKEKGIIKVLGPQRIECYCPLIDTKKTPAYVCDCSLGWQKQTFETILGKKVDVKIEESLLRGGKRCAMTVTILKGNAG
jgi:predicted ArsR family transcriptional regulator